MFACPSPEVEIRLVQTVYSQWHRFEVPEKQVIAGVCQDCPEFRALYDAERPKIASPEIHWYLKDDLPEESSAIMRVCQLHDMPRYEIYLRRLPENTSQAISVAHELLHCVFYKEGFPTTKDPARQLASLSTVLNNLLVHPLIVGRMQFYGFDLAEQHQRFVQSALKMLRQNPESYRDYLGELGFILGYAAHVLTWGTLYSRCELELMVEARYSEIARQSYELVNLVKMQGYDTPEKQRQLIREITRRYGLEEYVHHE